MQLTTTGSKDRVLIECIGLRLRGACNEYTGDLVFDERLRQHLQHALDAQKIEYPHNFDVEVRLTNEADRPRIEIHVGGLNLYNLG